MKIVVPAFARPLIEAALPEGLDVTWFTTPDEAVAGIAEAEVAWVDMQSTDATADVIRQAGPHLRWLSSIRAGVDGYPLPLLRERGVTVTNGTGLNAETVADYAAMGVLAAAKRLDEVVRAADRREWPTVSPGTIELAGTCALVVGYGTIGQLIGDRLRAFGIAVTGVTRSGRDGTLAADAWREKLGDVDWVILAAPSTANTRKLVGAEELAAMKAGAWLVNVARGDMVDQDALIAALGARRIGGAFLDTTDPEPLPPDHPLWEAPNCMITMHLSGRSQTSMFRRGAALFVQNLRAFVAGKPMRNVLDLEAGY